MKELATGRGPLFKLDREADYLPVLADSPAIQVLRDLDIKREDAFIILDAIFSGKLYTPEDKRQEARIANLVKYYQIGGTPTDVTLAELPDGKADLFDASASPVVGASIPYYMMEWVKKQ